MKLNYIIPILTLVIAKCNASIINSNPQLKYVFQSDIPNTTVDTNDDIPINDNINNSSTSNIDMNQTNNVNNNGNHHSVGNDNTGYHSSSHSTSSGNTSHHSSTGHSSSSNSNSESQSSDSHKSTHHSTNDNKSNTDNENVTNNTNNNFDDNTNNNINNDTNNDINNNTNNDINNNTNNNTGNTNGSITQEQLDNFEFGEKEYRLAIFGDTGVEKTSKEVMKLRPFDSLLHLGDYDYKCFPDDYFLLMLDKDRKYDFMGVVGNHDTKLACDIGDVPQRYVANIYHEMLSKKNTGIDCEFSPSKFMWACVHNNVRIIGLTPGIDGADKRNEQLAFLKKQLSDAKEDWKICSWHYYDNYYHTGRYQNSGNMVSGSGESFYDLCKDHGAIIFSAHDHVYARTHVMSQFSQPVIDKYDGAENGSVVQIRNGATLNVLNGVGGYSVYVEQGKEMSYPHWQKKFALGANEENKNKFGGLFCTFNYKGNSRKAFCEFPRLNSKEEVFDSFYIYRNDNPDTITYKNIDDTFNAEKLKAYKLAYNITDGEIGNPTIANADNDNGNANPNFNNSNVLLYFIIGSLVISGAVLLIHNYRSNRKRDTMTYDGNEFFNENIQNPNQFNTIGYSGSNGSSVNNYSTLGRNNTNFGTLNGNLNPYGNNNNFGNNNFGNNNFGINNFGNNTMGGNLYGSTNYGTISRNNNNFGTINGNYNFTTPINLNNNNYNSLNRNNSNFGTLNSNYGNNNYNNNNLNFQNNSLFNYNTN